MNLTPNFTIKEFGCKDGTPVPEEFLANVTELAKNLQVLRDYLSVPVEITGSGYRTPAHNKKVKGAKNSQHLYAKAADINAQGYTPAKLAQMIVILIASGKMKQGGIGIYRNFVHYDIRGTKARW
ncbi:MAG: YcbK family protein [Flavobacterium sp.]